MIDSRLGRFEYNQSHLHYQLIMWIRSSTHCIQTLVDRYQLGKILYSIRYYTVIPRMLHHQTKQSTNQEDRSPIIDHLLLSITNHANQKLYESHPILIVDNLGRFLNSYSPAISIKLHSPLSIDSNLQRFQVTQSIDHKSDVVTSYHYFV